MSEPLRVHELKSWPESFEPQQDGRKRAEFRRNDRDYHEGDYLILREWVPASERWTETEGEYTGAELARRVSWVDAWPSFGLPEGWACLTTEISGLTIAQLRERAAVPVPAEAATA